MVHGEEWNSKLDTSVAKSKPETPTAASYSKELNNIVLPSGLIAWID